MNEEAPMGKDVTVQLTGSEIRSATGQLGVNVAIQLTGCEARTETGRLSWVQVREYWEKRPLSVFLVGLLTLGSPFLGLFLAGWVGVVVGLVIGIVAFTGGLFAITRVREITRSQ
jgi:hypothetical protein